jgi:hypothetical protein
VVRNDSGGTDVGCHFVPDDGEQGVPMFFRNVGEDSVLFKGYGEFARGIMSGSGDDRSLLIKVTPAVMADAAEMAVDINAGETVRRAVLQRRCGPFFQKCGYGWNSSWRLIKAAPGLLRE